LVILLQFLSIKGAFKKRDSHFETNVQNDKSGHDSSPKLTLGKKWRKIANDSPQYSTRIGTTDDFTIYQSTVM